MQTPSSYLHSPLPLSRQPKSFAKALSTSLHPPHQAEAVGPHPASPSGIVQERLGRPGPLEVQERGRQRIPAYSLASILQHFTNFDIPESGFLQAFEQATGRASRSCS